MSIAHDGIVRTIDLYKSLRSVLQDNAIIYRSRLGVRLSLGTGYVVYATKLCGTYPARAVQGVISEDGFLVGIETETAVYSAPKCGETQAGTYPTTATQGGIENGGLGVNAAADAVMYSARLCGSAPGALT